MKRSIRGALAAVAALVTLAITGGLLAAPAALAYIPPAQFIIKDMASKRSGIHSVRIASIVKAVQPGASSASSVLGASGTSGVASQATSRHFKVVTIYNSLARTLRSQAFDSAGIELYSVEKKAEQLPLSVLVLYDSDSAEIVGALKRAGVPVRSQGETGDEVISLQRWNGSIAWALGLTPGPLNVAASAAATKPAQPKDGSQLWIEKDSFLPFRVLSGDADVQFSNYRYSQQLPYPRMTTLATREGVEQLEEDIQSFKINPSSAQFAAMLVEMSTAGVSSDGFTPAGESSPLKDLIRTYYAGIR